MKVLLVPSLVVRRVYLPVGAPGHGVRRRGGTRAGHECAYWTCSFRAQGLHESCERSSRTGGLLAELPWPTAEVVDLARAAKQARPKTCLCRGHRRPCSYQNYRDGWQVPQSIWPRLVCTIPLTFPGPSFRLSIDCQFSMKPNFEGCH